MKPCQLNSTHVNIKTLHCTGPLCVSVYDSFCALVFAKSWYQRSTIAVRLNKQKQGYRKQLANNWMTKPHLLIYDTYCFYDKMVLGFCSKNNQWHWKGEGDFITGTMVRSNQSKISFCVSYYMVQVFLFFFLFFFCFPSLLQYEIYTILGTSAIGCVNPVSTFMSWCNLYILPKGITYCPRAGSAKHHTSVTYTQ